MDRRKILLVDDEIHIQEMLRINMKSQGFDCLSAYTGEEALDMARNELPDLILLDVMMPGIDGVETCRRLKADKDLRAIPVIMVSAKSQGQDKIKGLEGGADDYITKPFSIHELFLRIKASLRQVDFLRNGHDGILRAGTLSLDTERHQVSTEGNRIDLTLKEFRILYLLMKNRAALISREEMIQQVFDMEPEKMGRTLDVHISNLRKKLEALNVSGCEIETVRGKGFRISP